jgi:hypothetical protein
MRCDKTDQRRNASRSGRQIKAARIAGHAIVQAFEKRQEDQADNRTQRSSRNVTEGKVHLAMAQCTMGVFKVAHD